MLDVTVRVLVARNVVAPPSRRASPPPKMGESKRTVVPFEIKSYKQQNTATTKVATKASVPYGTNYLSTV